MEQPRYISDVVEDRLGPGERVKPLQQAWAIAISSGQPVWKFMGRGLETICDHREWPDDIGFAFRPEEGRDEDVRDLAEILLEDWAPLEEWRVDPETERAPPGVYGWRIDVESLPEKRVRSLRKSLTIIRNPWVLASSPPEDVLIESD